MGICPILRSAELFSFDGARCSCTWKIDFASTAKLKPRQLSLTRLPIVMYWNGWRAGEVRQGNMNEFLFDASVARRDAVWLKRRFSTMPEAWSVIDVPWQLFATLTFKKAPIGYDFGKKAIFAWLRELAALQKVHFKRLFFCFMRENGASGDHPHYHVIVGGLGAVPSNFCATADRLWKNVRAAGFARIEPFDDSRDGVGYTLKQIDDYGRSNAVKSDYLEIPTLSESAFSFLGRLKR